MSLSFTCPCCRAHLKVRDESQVGQALKCPECQTPLLVAKSSAGDIIGQQIEQEPPAQVAVSDHKTGAKLASASKKPSTPNQAPAPVARTPVHTARKQNPQLVAWLVAGVFLLVLIPFLLPSNKAKKSSSVGPEEKTATSSDTVDADSEVKSNAQDGQSKTVENALPDTPEGRLAALGKLVRDRAIQDGHYPAGTVSGAALPPAHRWSWQAQIAAEHDNPMSNAINWNQRWNDPLTDRFVRRLIPRFQNPLAETQTSEDNYPASHFVGVAGVGADAPTLPIGHPRAGIFGQDRQTRLEDIRDGASNTMLLAGVTGHPGSWAEGTSSYRAFTKAPYVNGLDGFGTGQKKSMFVLMADGSVKEISETIDPVVVRRMAAMNDGLPLDPSVPGEPSDPIPAKPAPTPMVPPQVAENPPKSPDKPPKPNTPPVKPVAEIAIDIPGALSRKILNFDQSKPAAAYQLLLQIEELSGVRIEYDRENLGAAAERLDKPITLKMQNATLAELLDEILLQIKLQRKDERSLIRIVAPT